MRGLIKVTEKQSRNQTRQPGSYLAAFPRVRTSLALSLEPVLSVWLGGQRGSCSRRPLPVDSANSGQNCPFLTTPLHSYLLTFWARPSKSLSPNPSFPFSSGSQQVTTCQSYHCARPQCKGASWCLHLNRDLSLKSNNEALVGVGATGWGAFQRPLPGPRESVKAVLFLTRAEANFSP